MERFSDPDVDKVVWFYTVWCSRISVRSLPEGLYTRCGERSI